MLSPHIFYFNFFLLILKSLFYLSLIVICQLVTNHSQACTKKLKKNKIYHPTFRTLLGGIYFQNFSCCRVHSYYFQVKYIKLYDNHYYHDSLSVPHRQTAIVYFIAITNIMITHWHAQEHHCSNIKTKSTMAKVVKQVSLSIFNEIFNAIL